ncbi:phage holin family protein [Anaerolineales bacterium HSG6]|nr:phage holin family protein [Anaerolineales bacterium HSG6]MDM8532239.1 phage holin family protein [Anaerolineales bacterium HSG25]
MYHLLIGLVINAISLWVAAFIVPGIYFDTSLMGIFTVALIFGVVNTLIKPIFQILTCPFYILTLGLFTFVINALMLMLTSWLSGEAFHVDSFWWALLGSIIISIISTFLSLFLEPKKQQYEDNEGEVVIIKHHE